MGLLNNTLPDNLFHPLSHTYVYISKNLYVEEPVRKRLEEYKAKIADELTKDTSLIVVGEEPSPEEKERLAKLLWNGYDIPLIREEELLELLQQDDWGNDLCLYWRDRIKPPSQDYKSRKELNITYDNLFNLEYSPFAHLDFRASESPLRGKRIYFPTDEEEWATFKLYLKDEGADIMEEFVPEQTDYCLLTEKTLEKLRRGKRDRTIQEIEYNYNKSSCEEFRCLFLRIKELVFLLFESAKGNSKKEHALICNKYKNKLFDIKVPRRVIHYTDMNALPNMLTDKSIVLRATNILYMNDSREFWEGHDIARKTVNKIAGQAGAPNGIIQLKKTLDNMKHDICQNFYVTSFCKNDDDLAMWAMYADNGRGCALEFKGSIVAHEFQKVNTFFVKCNYNLEEVRDYYNNLLTGCISSRSAGAGTLAVNVDDAIKICLTTKHPGFRNEEEWRGVIKDGCGRYGFSFRVRNNHITPYVELEIPAEALVRVILGPNTDELSGKSIIHLLKTNGYNNVEVVKSELPYRG